MSTAFKASFALFACALLAACSHSTVLPVAPGGSLSGPESRVGPRATNDAGVMQDVKHVIVIVQENRSFDNLFHGFAGANYANSGVWMGKTLKLAPISFADNFELCHKWADANTDIGTKGTMDGFGHCNPADPGQAYSYVKSTETMPYTMMAKQYGLGDNFFSDQLDSSYVAHQYLIAGQAGNAENVPSATPWGCDAKAGTTVGIANTKGQIVNNVFPCFTYTTLANQLDAAGLSWRYYAPGSTNAAYIWSAYDAVHSIREGSDWATNVVSPQCSVISDIAAGKLATVTWVVPNLPDSDHPLSLSKTGPAWVASVVNAVGKSQFWDSTAIFVTWDDWGGFYDHVVPPNYGKFWDGPGIRVPFIAIGAYAKKGTISHTQYQTASILKSMEIWLGLKQMGWADTQALPFWQDFFDFNQTARKFTPIPHAKYSCQASLSNQPPDTDF